MTAPERLGVWTLSTTPNGPAARALCLAPPPVSPAQTGPAQTGPAQPSLALLSTAQSSQAFLDSARSEHGPKHIGRNVTRVLTSVTRVTHVTLRKIVFKFFRVSARVYPQFFFECQRECTPILFWSVNASVPPFFFLVSTRVHPHFFLSVNASVPPGFLFGCQHEC